MKAPNCKNPNCDGGFISGGDSMGMYHVRCYCNPEPFDLTRPVHLLANDLLHRLEIRAGVVFGAASHVDVELLIRQLREVHK